MVPVRGLTPCLSTQLLIGYVPVHLSANRTLALSPCFDFISH
jgi:hypothetical protein